MADERPDRLESSRRDYVKYGAAVGVGGLLAGCTSDAGSSSGPTDDGPETENETTEGDDGGTTSAEESTEDTGYSVTMSP
ncbi:ABC transporter substrate-binding protein, partial [Halorubrum sp. SS5]